MPTLTSTALALDPRWKEILLFVLVVPPVLVVSDMALLNLCAFSGNLILWLLTYVWYSLQTAAVGYWVGNRLHRSRWWWGILAWTVMLVDGQVFAIVIPNSGWYDPAMSLGFAYASAQIGLAVVWAVLGTGSWRLRFPLFIGGFGWAMILGMILGDEGMMVLLIGQTIATAICCFALTVSRFRFQKPVDGNSQKLFQSHSNQFSIRHLFFWTTIVGILATIMRWFDWNSLLVHFRLRDLPQAIWFTLALTLVTMVATWITLGRERWMLRVPLGVLFLPGVGLAIGYLGGLGSRASWLFRFVPSWTSTAEWMLMWAMWTAMSGLFLAGLLLVFRAAGLRLIRVNK